ncbi:PEP-CTERM sorting domain-containing protein [Mucisphaera sp.]|uniref:PEP-CTERM sorting domain-containing protein n=1 Tax=Mucisphaera sp. TaxID=2913024 RepID=UPI003D0D9A7A
MKKFALATVASLAFAGAAQAAFIVEVDVDGLDDGPFTPSANFAFGGDTTTASTSIAGTAVGLTGGDSLFGGNGTAVDTYTYSYTPGVDADNLVLAPGTALNNAGSFATGLAGGASDVYTIYATWPATTNVSGGDVTFTLEGSDSSSQVLAVLDQNGNDGTWVKLGSAPLTAGVTYTVVQESGAATFVSMRAAAVMFEVPEPASAALLGLGGLAALRRRVA